MRLKNLLLLTYLILALSYFGCKAAEAKGLSSTLYSEAALRTMAAEIATKHGIDPLIFQAIITQESNWKVNAINKRSHDLGLGQINPHNVRYYGLDAKRLLTDPRYNLEAAIVILAWFKRTYKHEPLWFARFNCGTRKIPVEESKVCMAYVLKVSAYLPNNHRVIASIPNE